MELLVVIGLVAILIALLLPVLNRAREQARMVKCQSNMRQIVLACLMYADANHQILPIAGSIQNEQGWYFALQNTGPGMLDFNVGTLLPYIARNPTSREGAFNCPTDGPDRLVGTNDGHGGNLDPTLSARNFSYCYNDGMRGHPYGSIHVGGNTLIPLYSGVRLGRVTHPDHKFLIMEFERPRWAVGDVSGGISRPDGGTDVIVFLTARHGGLCNIGYVDGHVGPLDRRVFLPTGNWPADQQRAQSYIDPAGPWAP